MAKHLTTVESVIGALGGPTSVARLAGYKWASTVSNWRSEGFPCKTFLVLQAALSDIGCTASPDLWGVPIPGGWEFRPGPEEVCLVKSARTASAA